jgi:hypothetical protein
MNYEVCYINDGIHGQQMFTICGGWADYDEDYQIYPERYYDPEDPFRGSRRYKVFTLENKNCINTLRKRHKIPEESDKDWREFYNEITNFNKIADERFDLSNKINNSKSWDEDSLIIEQFNNFIDAWVEQWSNKVKWLFW